MAAFLAEAEQPISVDAALARDTLTLYGFADFTYSRTWGEGTADALVPFGSFAVGNLNLYLDAQLDESWRSLSEVRFTYLPHGNFEVDGSYANTTSLDYSDNYGEMRTGGIEIERTWIEYGPRNWFTIRGGQWLTPYGIWNVDHGSPTLLGIQKPYLVSSAMFPERQTGLMVHGTLNVGDASDLRYFLTFSNGRGFVDEYRDLDDDNALGGRVELQHFGDAKIRAGLSGYRGRYTNAETALGITNDGVVVDLVPVVQYDEVAIAADLRVQWANLQLLVEGIYGEVAYVDGARPAGQRGLLPDPQADLRRGGFYTILGYELPSLRLTPLIGYEFIQDPLSVGRTQYFRGGLRFTPVAAVTIKVEYARFKPLKSLSIPGIVELDTLNCQIAWAFQ